MYVLGLNAYHADSSACLLRSGKIVAAAEEERFRRVKHWAGLPTQAIAYCLAEAGIALSEVSHIAINTNPKAALGKKIGYALRHLPEPKLILDRLRNQRRAAVAARRSWTRHFPASASAASCIISSIISRISHPRFWCRPSKRRRRFRSTASAISAAPPGASAAATQIDIEGRVHFPHSLGVFYQALTQYLGFPHYGDEYKVMGLAPYGRPDHWPRCAGSCVCCRMGASSSTSDTSGITSRRSTTRGTGGSPHVGTLYSARAGGAARPRRGSRPTARPAPQRHRASAQAMYEEAFFHLLEASLSAHGHAHSLALAGGCAMNSVANGKVARVDAVQAALRAVGGGRCGRRDRRAAIVWQHHGRRLQVADQEPSSGAHGRQRFAAVHHGARLSRQSCLAMTRSPGC